jgi:hypothetical protein
MLQHMLEFVIGLVEGKEATDAEQHDRHDEGIDIAFTPEAKGCCAVGAR